MGEWWQVLIVPAVYLAIGAWVMHQDQQQRGWKRARIVLTWPFHFMK